MASGELNAVERQDEGAVELPAPSGWKKQLTQKKSGTPRRNEIVFISPTGEEIKSKRQLDHFLKSHPGGPSASEFDWSTGETPRRSTRISEKVKATETPENEPPPKRYSGKKGVKAKKQDTEVGYEDAEDKEDAAAGEETKASEEVEMKDAVEDDLAKNKGDVPDKESDEAVHETSSEKVENPGATGEAEKEQLDKESQAPQVEEAKDDTENNLAEPEFEGKTASDAKEEHMGSEGPASVGSVDKKEGSEDKPAESEAPSVQKESEPPECAKDGLPGADIKAVRDLHPEEVGVDGNKAS
ncbi:methyl-CpG-binding domain-containing protein 11-like isoform X2 [Rhodamnia argentea]|uniref:Methyl-CpG-binding domain-containing protein 11-like isoform X2 n=1 Tax=Rhodamnia argentea TaxID=178133 RepID=A0A8B8NE31_9MYRT|nr:methyl-CpG-binding domain-containing protein 11-like isoform X2 [Rhodamnia argentea]XP_048136261.1 methyl-CpG-binding domain-containing protein 11-like isoform X2 [Rhodamnia argentea]